MSERAVSIAVNYVLALAIVALLLSGLFVAMGDFVENEREQVARSEFDVLGNRVAADLAAADRLARTVDGGGNVSLQTSLPSRVAGSGYQIEVASDGSDPYAVDITLTSTMLDVSRTVTVQTRTDVTATTVDGGSLQISYSNGGQLEVHDG